MWRVLVGAVIVVLSAAALAIGSPTVKVVAVVTIALILGLLWYAEPGEKEEIYCNSPLTEHGKNRANSAALSHPFSILNYLAVEVLKSKVLPKTIYLSQKYYMMFVRENMDIFYRYEDHPDPKFCFMGIPVVYEPPTEFCRGCGAQVHSEECDYCQLPSEYIRVSDQPIVDHGNITNQGMVDSRHL